MIVTLFRTSASGASVMASVPLRRTAHCVQYRSSLLHSQPRLTGRAVLSWSAASRQPGSEHLDPDGPGAFLRDVHECTRFAAAIACWQAILKYSNRSTTACSWHHSGCQTQRVATSLFMSTKVRRVKDEPAPSSMVEWAGLARCPSVSWHRENRGASQLPVARFQPP
jgi:hypothetical protein